MIFSDSSVGRTTDFTSRGHEFESRVNLFLFFSKILKIKLAMTFFREHEKMNKLCAIC